MKKAIFLDRDGVVNKRLIDDYVKNWDEFQFIPDIFEVLGDIHQEEYLAILVTNQRGVGRGIMTRNDLHNVHRKMQQALLQKTGHQLDGIYACPHNNDDRCDCRKPAPKMLLQAAKDFQIDLQKSWMIGDSESDVMAGISAGCRTVKIGEDDDLTEAKATKPNLQTAWLWLKAEGSKLKA